MERKREIEKNKGKNREKDREIKNIKRKNAKSINTKDIEAVVEIDLIAAYIFINYLN